MLHIPIPELRRVGNNWMVDFKNTPQEIEMRRLFGTTILPTPWTDSTSRHDVILYLAQHGTVVA